MNSEFRIKCQARLTDIRSLSQLSDLITKDLSSLNEPCIQAMSDLVYGFYW